MTQRWGKTGTWWVVVNVKSSRYVDGDHGFLTPIREYARQFRNIKSAESFITRKFYNSSRDYSPQKVIFMRGTDGKVSSVKSS